MMPPIKGLAYKDNINNKKVQKTGHKLRILSQLYFLQPLEGLVFKDDISHFYKKNAYKVTISSQLYFCNLYGGQLTKMTFAKVK